MYYYRISVCVVVNVFVTTKQRVVVSHLSQGELFYTIRGWTVGPLSRNGSSLVHSYFLD